MAKGQMRVDELIFTQVLGGGKGTCTSGLRAHWAAWKAASEAVHSSATAAVAASRCASTPSASISACFSSPVLACAANPYCEVDMGSDHTPQDRFAECGTVECLHSCQHRHSMPLQYSEFCPSRNDTLDASNIFVWRTS